MTVGSRTWGSSTPVSTSYGMSTIDDLVQKTWSGADYPPSAPREWREPGSFSYLVNRNGKLVRINQTFSGVIPRVRTPRRVVVEHPYSMTLNALTDRYLEVSDDGGASWYSCTGKNANFFQNFNHSWESNDDLALLGRLRTRVAGSDFNAGVFLAELSPALGMITNAATRLYRGWKSARRGDFLTAARALTHGTPREHLFQRKSVASNWLELQYGWLPLLADAKAGAEFCAHQLSVPRKVVVSVSMQRDSDISGGNFAVSFSGKAFYGKKLKAILSEVNTPALAGLLDPLSVAWELTPYSFVIDWFLPIGDYLSARGLAQALSGVFVTSTFAFGEMRVNGIKPAFNKIERTGNLSRLRKQSISLSREVSTSLTVPLPSATPLSKAISWKRAANSVALLSQLKK